MDLLKKIFPYSFAEKKDLASAIILAVIHLVVGLVIGIVIGLLVKIPVLGIIIGLLGGLVDLYMLVAIVLIFLDFFKILK